MCRRRAVAELAGLGDPELGEWHEWSGVAYHVRRRLSPAEQVLVGEVADIRGTREAVRRAEALGARLAYAAPAIVAHELGPAGTDVRTAAQRHHSIIARRRV